MSGFAWGLFAGFVVCGAISIIVAMNTFKRVDRLKRRAIQAERMAELGLLTGGLAHEIKNPLSTVQLNLQLLKEDIDPQHPASARVLNRLGTVTRETSRLKDILDDFLRFAGKMEIERKPEEINALLEELADFFSPQAAANRVQLRLRKSDSPITVPIDARLIKQAILNLMINATQAMPAGGDLILQAGQRDGQAIIDVIDTGVGIPPESVDKIFQAYFSTKKGGTGLGLPVTKRIIDEHGGQIVVNSEVGKGSDFSVRLPLRPAT